MISRGGEKTRMNDELEALILSEKELDRESVADILLPYVRLDKDACNIRPLEAWLGLRTDLKILVYLLARKAMVALGFDLEVEGATASEVAHDIDLKQSTVNLVLRKIRSEGTLIQAKDRRYFVPNDAVETIKGMVSNQSLLRIPRAEKKYKKRSKRQSKGQRQKGKPRL